MSEITYKEVELSPLRKAEWSKTKAALVMGAPGFTHIFYTMMNPKQDDSMVYWTPDVAVAATDGRRMFANEEVFFADFSVAERVFVTCHEIGHAMFDHCGVSVRLQKNGGTVNCGTRELPYIHVLAGQAQDYVINDMLIESRIGKMPVGKWAGLHDPKIGNYKESWVTVYERLFDQASANGQIKQLMIEAKGGDGKGDGSSQPGKKPGQPGGGFDEHLAPGTSEGKDADDPSVQHNEQKWKMAVQAAKCIAQAQGKLPAALEMFFGMFLEPAVDWTHRIEAVFSRKVGSGSYDYRKPDRRLITRDIYAPARSGHGAGTIVVGIDTSGSVFAVPHLIDRWLAEISGIIEDLRPRRIIVIECDAQVQKVAEIEDETDLRRYAATPSRGGGGTSFKPVFKWIREEGIDDLDCLVYLTDGDGSFPKEAPDYNVIWGDITNTESKYPFGDWVPIPADGTA